MSNKFNIKQIRNYKVLFHNCRNPKKCRAVLYNPETKMNEKWEGIFSITARTGGSIHGEEMIYQFVPKEKLSVECPNGKNKTFEFYEGLEEGINHMENITSHCKKLDKTKTPKICKGNEYEEGNNKDNVEKLIVKILKEIGENPKRDGLIETPKRISKMYKEIFRGYDESKKPKVTLFNNGQDGIIYDQMITDEGSFYSFCEHHFMPFFGNYYFAYIPSKHGKILGLSKVARVVDYFSSKLQIQERLVNEIVEYLWEELSNGDEPLGMAMIMKGEHLCKSMRGVKKKGQMITSVMKGCFKTNSKTKEEFLNLIK